MKHMKFNEGVFASPTASECLSILFGFWAVILIVARVQPTKFFILVG
jgi:hypothetical protein